MLEELKARYPWPEEIPKVSARIRGWHKKEILKMFRRLVVSDAKVIVELGSWIGDSTIDLLECAPEATVICIDHWKGSPEQRANEYLREMLPQLYEMFIVNMWPDKDRIIPLRENTTTALDILHQMDLYPDAIYIDADHTREQVFLDLDACLRLFPKATIMGDDWLMESVRLAVKDCLKERRKNLKPKHDKNAWWLVKKQS